MNMRNYIAAALIAAAVATTGCGKSANSTPASTIASQPAVAATTPPLDAHTAAAAIDAAYAPTMPTARYNADPVGSWPAVAVGPNAPFLHALLVHDIATQRVEHRVIETTYGDGGQVYAVKLIRPRAASPEVSGDVGAPAFHVADKASGKILKITNNSDDAATVSFHPGLILRPWARGIAIAGLAADETVLAATTCSAKLVRSGSQWIAGHIDCPHQIAYVGATLTAANSQRIGYPSNLSIVASASDMSGLTTYPCAYEPPSTMEMMTGGSGHLRIPRDAPRDVAMFYPNDPSALPDSRATAGKCAANS